MGNGKYKIIEEQRRANLFLIESHVKNNVPTIVCHPFFLPFVLGGGALENCATEPLSSS